MRIVYLFTLSCILALTGCADMQIARYYPQCRTWDVCPYSGQQRQYVRAPDGWGGKYCSQYPERC